MILKLCCKKDGAFIKNKLVAIKYTEISALSIVYDKFILL